MLWTIIVKELKNNLTSLRFFITLTLVMIITIISSVLFVKEYHHEISDYRKTVNENNEELINNAENLSSLAHIQQQIQIKPTPMELVSEGGLKNIPKTFRTSTFLFNIIESGDEESKFIRDFKDIDWEFIIAIILSFFAILMTYDSINGEKRDGTLRLMMSNSVSRSMVTVSKYISGMISIVIPLVMGIVLSVLVVNVYGQLQFSISQVFRMIITVVAALIYLSIFLLIGLLLSSTTRSPVTSIIILLFIWVSFAVLIPNSGGKIAARLFPVPTQEQINRQIEEQQQEIRNSWRSRYSKTFNWNGDPRAEWVPYRCGAVNDMDAAENSIRNQYMYQRLNQINKTKSLLKVSPTLVFSSVVERISLTGLAKFEHFYKQFRDYRRLFREYIENRDKEDPDSPHCVYRWESSPMSQKPVEPDGIPRFHEQTPSVTQSINAAMFDFILLIMFNLILFVLVYITFARYDVR